MDTDRVSLYSEYNVPVLVEEGMGCRYGIWSSMRTNPDVDFLYPAGKVGARPTFPFDRAAPAASM